MDDALSHMKHSEQLKQDMVDAPLDDSEHRECMRCRRERPLVLFPKRPRSSEHGHVCQACVEESSDQRAWQAFVRRRAHALWSATRVKAWRQGVAFDLPLAWFEARLDKGVCEATGLPLDLDDPKSPWAPAIDRILLPKSPYNRHSCRIAVAAYVAAKGGPNGAHAIAIKLAEALLKTTVGHPNG